VFCVQAHACIHRRMWASTLAHTHSLVQHTQRQPRNFFFLTTWHQRTRAHLRADTHVGFGLGLGFTGQKKATDTRKVIPNDSRRHTHTQTHTHTHTHAQTHTHTHSHTLTHTHTHTHTHTKRHIHTHTLGIRIRGGGLIFRVENLRVEHLGSRVCGVAGSRHTERDLLILK
jgi:hypothetical protein